MNPNEHRLLRFAALILIVLVVALVPRFRRRHHPFRWARAGVHDVIQPAEHAAMGLLGLDTPAPSRSELLADAAVVAIGIAEAVEHRHSRG